MPRKIPACALHLGRSTGLQEERFTKRACWNLPPKLLKIIKQTQRTPKELGNYMPAVYNAAHDMKYALRRKGFLTRVMICQNPKLAPKKKGAKTTKTRKPTEFQYCIYTRPKPEREDVPISGIVAEVAKGIKHLASDLGL